jgi:plasmid stabilization system protein ParE
MRFLSTFEDSFAITVDFYKSIDRALAKRFIDAVDEAMDQIDRFPKIGKQTSSYRLLPVKGFPFSFCYDIDTRGAVALVLHHSSMKPPRK